ncbi:hypothetical protein SE17_08930 [Kouleothrix aurantiaca]|uniref:Uncharacterized protein n=1 Tax=Kouleothrix aurantiaca TaxID=186479 RepID=A0A0N8PSS8_9CHLR|nr:hypothetical protein SE17_08930 [Kouleothrix aurantiaca]
MTCVFGKRILKPIHDPLIIGKRVSCLSRMQTSLLGQTTEFVGRIAITTDELNVVLKKKLNQIIAARLARHVVASGNQDVGSAQCGKSIEDSRKARIIAVDIRKERETHGDAPADEFVSKRLADHEAVAWMEIRPTGCALAAPPPINGNTIVAETDAEKGTISLDAKRRPLQARVSPRRYCHGS